MVQVTIADVVKGKAELEGRPSPLRIVVLHDQANHRALPIWVGPFEGDSIALGILQPSVPRPMTYNFIARILEAAGAKLEEVRIQTLKDDTYYAVAKLRRGDSVHEVDARPSDAIALAQRTGAPILVADEIMEKAGLDIAWVAGKTPAGEIEFASVLKEMQEKPQRFPGHPAPPPQPQPQTQPSPRNISQEIVAFVFAGETKSE